MNGSFETSPLNDSPPICPRFPRGKEKEGKKLTQKDTHSYLGLGLEWQ